MPVNSEDVTVDHLFDALVALGNPTVFYPDDHDTPDASDMPQLLGAIECTASKQLVRHEPDTDLWQAWAAGWLGTAGAGTSACGSSAAFELIVLRLQTTERLLAGYRLDAPIMQLIRACMEATTFYATAHALAGAAHAATAAGSQDAEHYRQLSRVQAHRGQKAVFTAHDLQRVMFGRYQGPDLTGADDK